MLNRVFYNRTLVFKEKRNNFYFRINIYILG